MRLGTRVEGRDGVQTLKAKDDRIKWVWMLLLYIIALNYEHALGSV